MATRAVARNIFQFSRRRFLQQDRHNALFLWQQGRSFASYPPHQVVGLPSLSPTMDTGSIANWNLKEGDAFAPGDVFCSVETDKATVDFEAQEEGFLAKILAQVGGDVKVGAPIMVTVDDASNVPAFANFKLDGASPVTPAAPAATPPPVEAPAAPKTVSNAAPSTSAASTGGRVVASPLAFKLAKEHGYDIAKISGTGPKGRVIAADVKEYVPSTAAAATVVTEATTTAEQQQQVKVAAPAQAVLTAAAPVAGDGYTDYPLTEQAKEIASRLVQSKRNVPHYYLTIDISCDKLLATRATLNQVLPADAQLGVYELLLKAVAMSMKTVPSANASWMDSVVRVYDSVDLNVVLGSGEELCTPVLKDVARKGVRAISQELQTAVKALEEGAAVPSGLGTFTVINLGMYGVKSCAPIIREPQAGALALGALENRIVPNDDVDSDGDSSSSDDEGSIYKQSVVLTATLSCDHRVVDGAVGAQWLAAFKSYVENPTTLLL